jgi:23S rRNA (adenine2030-N6)-methyltransferase
MFSYRHGFHAGNHADVLKHAILVSLLSYMGRKDKAYWYIDTHAGAGAYSLTEGFAAKREEFHNGIGRLWGRTDAPPLIRRYLAQIAEMNRSTQALAGDEVQSDDAARHLNEPPDALRYYPGSPYLAWQQMRPQDRMRLFELHPSEIDILSDNFEDARRLAVITRADGFEAIRSVLPPAPRRALTLIDPSYEDKQDYDRTIDAVNEALRRFPNGVYAIWYPIVQRAEAQSLPQRLHALGCASWLHATLNIAGPPADGFGLYGSGLFVINPPFVLEAELAEALPWLRDALAEDDGARFTLDAYIP